MSMKAATGIPIKYLSIGEKLDQIEQKHQILAVLVLTNIMRDSLEVYLIMGVFH